MRFLAPLLLLSVTSCSFFKQEDEHQEQATVAQEAIPYVTIFRGNLSPELLGVVEKASILKRLEKRPPLTLFALEKRAEKDMKEITEELNVHGYFDAAATFTITDDNGTKDIDVTVAPGAAYTFSGLGILYEGENPGTSLDPAAIDPSLFIGAQVNLQRAQETAKKIAKYFRNHGYPFAKALDLKGDLDKVHKTAKVFFVLKLGPKCVFGKTSVGGLENLSEEYVRNRFDYEEGEAFDESKVDSSRKALTETGLFNDINVQAVEEESLGNQAKIHVRLKEGPPRSIGFGAKYSSSDNASGRMFWRHDNSFGGGESFESSLLVGKRKDEAKIALSTPDFISPKQTLYNAITLTDEKARAYRSKGGKVSAILSRDLAPIVQLSYGLEYEIAKIRKNKVYKHSRLLSLPITLEIDSTNDILNPREGMKLRLKTTPYMGRYAGKNGFLVNEAFTSFYLHPTFNEISENDNVSVLAGWAKGGHITASSVDYVPPNKRFYSGGGNSVRGYGYQLLGPLDNVRTPIGGLSIVEFGIEPRVRLSEKFGCVVFLEGATVGLKHSPRFDSQNLLWGVGVGARYYTGVGPVRFDLGFPLKRRNSQGSRKKIDAPFQFFISVGQAF